MCVQSTVVDTTGVNKTSAVAARMTTDMTLEKSWLGNFLQRLDLAQYFSSFVNDGYDQFDDVYHMTLSDILAIEGMKPGHAKRIIRNVQKDKSRLLPPVNNRFNACITYTPHETVIRDVWQKEIPEIEPITVNCGQVSIKPTKPLPWNLNSPLTKILKITEYNSCQIALPVINFLTTQRVFSSENGVHAIVNYFTQIIVDSAALGKSLKQERDRNDASSTSESTGSSKSKKFRVDSIIALKGTTLVRIEEKKGADGLHKAQRELVKKISKDWVDKYCTAPFIIGIAVAGNIWTFHRITPKHVQEREVPKKWLQIDTDTGEGRLRGLQVAVHIASLLRLFSNAYVRDRSVPFEKLVQRPHCDIFITQKDNPHVKKWYVCLLSSMHSIKNIYEFGICPDAGTAIDLSTIRLLHF